jgi:hypothetical protein
VIGGLAVADAILDDRGGNPRLDANGKPIFNQIIFSRSRDG